MSICKPAEKPPSPDAASGRPAELTALETHAACADGLRKSDLPPLLIFFAVIILINVLSVRHNWMTSDESFHFNYGLSVARLDPTRHDDVRMDDSKMPVSVLNVLPYLVADYLHLQPTNAFNRLFTERQTLPGRFVTVLFSLVVVTVIYRWTHELYGRKAALFAAFLYSFEPNIIAHSQVVTTDLYAAGMIALATYVFWRFLSVGTWRAAVTSAVVLGLSQLVKYTCIYLFPIFLSLVLVKYSPGVAALIRQRSINRLSKMAMSFLGFFLLFMAISVLIINAGFLFHRTLTPIQNYEFKSDLFKGLQRECPLLSALPLPLPYPFVQGLDLVKYHETTGDSYGSIYLFGRLRERGPDFQGFNGYFLYAFLFKTPLALQIILLSALVRYGMRWSAARFMERELFLFLPVVFFSVYFNFNYNTQIGIRHFLVVFPFLLVFCGSLVNGWDRFDVKRKLVVIGLSVYLIVSVLSYFPHYLPYFNELVGDRKTAYRILADSNLDWGQGQWYLTNYLEQHPACIDHPAHPTAGCIVVRANLLVGIEDPERYRWLREHFKPVDNIAYAYLVFDVLPADLEKFHLLETLPRGNPDAKQ